MQAFTLLLWIQQGAEYLLNPNHRIIAIGIGLFIIFTLGRFIIKKGTKLILFVVIIFSIVYFGLKYLTTLM